MSIDVPQRRNIEAAESPRMGPLRFTAGAPSSHRPRKRWEGERDWGGLIAKLFCALFAFVGVVPLLVGGLVRVDAVQLYAAERTSTLLRDELGLEASYRLRMNPWPLKVTLEDLEIASSDGGAPFLEAQRVEARPRLFSLLAGKIELGEVAIDVPHLRVVMREGKIANLALRERASTGEKSPIVTEIEQRFGHWLVLVGAAKEVPPPAKRTALPLSAVSLTNAQIDLTIDDTRVTAGEIDLDVSLEEGPLEISLRAGRATIDRRHPDPRQADWDMVDEDVVCHFDLRARVSPRDLVVRRLELESSADLDPESGTRPPCDLPDDDWRKLGVVLTSGRVDLDESSQLERIDGRVKVRGAMALVHRFVPLLPAAGWVEADLDELRYEPANHRLPQITGTLRGAELGFDGKVIAASIDTRVETSGDTIAVSNAKVGWGGGMAQIARAEVRPFDPGKPLTAGPVEVVGVTLEDLLDAIGVHPNSHVGWAIAKVNVARFAGTLDPIDLSGAMKAETHSFAIYDRPTTARDKRTMMGVERGDLDGTFKVTPDAIVLSSYTVRTPRSQLRTTVSIGYEEALGVTVFEGSTLDFDDVSPLLDIPMKGKARVRATARGNADHPIIEGELSVDDFEFAGFALGDIHQTKARFEPMKLELTAARLTTGESTIDVPRLKLDFADGDAGVVLDGEADTRASGLHLVDFLRVVKLENDPRWRGVSGLAQGTARVSFVLGGRRDRCGGGRLEVSSRMNFANLSLWGETYPKGSMDFEYRWTDIPAGDRGIELDLHAGVLQKGGGTLLARAMIRNGATLQADITGSAIPLGSINALETVFAPPTAATPGEERVRPEAEISFVASVDGTLDRIHAVADVDVSAMRIGPDVLPTSRLRVEVEPQLPPAKAARRSRCQNDIFGERKIVMTPADDPVEGVIKLSGKLFGEQVAFDDVEITQQREKMASGTLHLRKLDLGAFANLLPDVAFSASPPDGELSADVHVEELPLDDPGLAEVLVFLHRADVRRDGNRVSVGAVPEPIVLSGDALRIPPLPALVRLRSGLRARLIAGGTLSHLSTQNPGLAIEARLDPVDLSDIGVDIPAIERAAGTVRARMTVGGTFREPVLGGQLSLRDGMMRIEGVPLPLEDINIDVRVEGGELRIRRARARAGNTGFLSLSGRAPLRGFDLASASATLAARDVKLPLADGIRATVDANLQITYEPSSQPGRRFDGTPAGGDRALPNVTGTIALTHFVYTRPMSLSLVDINRLATRRRTEVETYDPDEDLFSFDVTLVSPRPLTISNSLVDMRLEVAPPGLQLSGTNQRFGARGALRVVRGGKLFLQGHDFAMQDGTVSFDHPTRIAPRLDIHATTEYQRYASSGDLSSGTAADAGSSASTSGRWRISMHASGDLEQPTVRFTSDPALDQDDIVLLLQIGMTRAELERAQLAGFGGVGLEALTTFGGVNQAVQKSLPLFDEVHVGSQYSSRSGRPEPTVTVGKRLSDNVRATVSSSVSETREVRSSIEWNFHRNMSIQGRYDNVNDVSSSSVGNVGGDFRFHFEFE
jgi:translocation and assembly module TamB